MSKKIDSKKILELFFNSPSREFHIREAAKITGINPMTTSKYLEEFRKSGILIKNKERGHVLYSANAEDRIFRQEKIHYNVIRMLKSGMINFIEKEMNYPECIIIFGSFAKGENIPTSDIDIFILSADKRKMPMESFEDKLGAKIQLFIHSKKEFERMKRDNKGLFNNIANGIKLSGFLEVT